MADLHDSIAKAVPQIERGKVWCIACGRMQRVDGAEALRHGWPKCCGATMTIDSPQWRRAHPRGVRASAAPLSEERLHELATAAGFGFFGQWQLYQGARAELVAFARAVEAAHGVTRTEDETGGQQK